MIMIIMMIQGENINYNVPSSQSNVIPNTCILKTCETFRFKLIMSNYNRSDLFLSLHNVNTTATLRLFSIP